MPARSRAAGRQVLYGLAAGLLVLGAARIAAPPAAEPAGDGVATVQASPDEVLERVTPGAARDGARGRDPQSGPRAPPTDPDAALQVARRHLERARATGDSRESGRAQAALALWWDDRQAPDEVLLMRAALHQHQHAFDAALRDLATLLERRPDHRDGWWLQASLQQTLGRLDEARASCTRMTALDAAAALAGHVCLAELDSLRGDRDATPRLIARLGALPLNAAQGAWLRLVLAEIAEREGRDDDAQRLYRLAVRDATHPYARVAFADWLLDRGRDDEAAALLAVAPETDAVLVRRAIAAHRRGDPERDRLVRTVRARFDAAERRGDEPHARERARLALDVEGDPAVALAMARRNWSMQKEPADLLLLARAARAAGDEPTLDAVRAHVTARAWSDVRLVRTGVLP